MVTWRSVRWLVGVVGLVVVGCGGPPAEELYAAGEAAKADTSTQAVALERFGELLRRYPRHALAPEALRQMAMISQQRGEMQQAIEQYQRLLREYPKSDWGDEAQFMIAYINDEYLRDFDQARTAYQAVIDHYPDSKWAASAQRLLTNVGRDPEEWVEFQDVARPARAP